MKHMKLSILLAGIAIIAMIMAPVSGATLNLVEKNPTTWEELDGNTGTFDYTCDGFTFTASGLDHSADYELISYAEPYPGVGSNILGSGRTDENGSIVITGSSEWASDLVINTYDANAEGDYKNTTGAKVWLIKPADFDGAKFSVWNPAEYLFDQNLINPMCSVSEGSSTIVTGSISKTLTISTDTTALDFGAFGVGSNRKDLGTIKVTSSFVPTWKVTGATSDGQGYMRIGSPFVTGTKLTNPLQQYNYKASAWQNANGLTYTGTGDYNMQMTFVQNVLVSDIPGEYGTTVTYTVSEI